MKALQRLAALKALMDFRSTQLQPGDAWMLDVLLVFAPLVMLARAIRSLMKV